MSVGCASQPFASSPHAAAVSRRRPRASRALSRASYGILLAPTHRRTRGSVRTHAGSGAGPPAVRVSTPDARSTASRAFGARRASGPAARPSTAPARAAPRRAPVCRGVTGWCPPGPTRCRPFSGRSRHTPGGPATSLCSERRRVVVAVEHHDRVGRQPRRGVRQQRGRHAPLGHGQARHAPRRDPPALGDERVRLVPRPRAVAGSARFGEPAADLAARRLPVLADRADRPRLAVEVALVAQQPAFGELVVHAPEDRVARVGPHAPRELAD